jgi:hypothetical protein
MDPISIVLGLAAVAPKILDLFGAGKDTVAVAETVAGAAKAVTGEADLQTAADKIMADPQLALQLQGQLVSLEATALREETKRLAEVNETMRAEYESGSTYKTGWRPFIGWTFGGSLAVYVLSMCAGFLIAVVGDPKTAKDIVSSMSELASALSLTWGSCLAVLGVAVKMRSDDKKTASGLPTLGIADALARRIAAKG